MLIRSEAALHFTMQIKHLKTFWLDKEDYKWLKLLQSQSCKDHVYIYDYFDQGPSYSDGVPSAQPQVYYTSLLWRRKKVIIVH